MALFAMDLATRKVEVLGTQPQSSGPWIQQIARNLTGEGGPPACVVESTVL